MAMRFPQKFSGVNLDSWLSEMETFLYEIEIPMEKWVEFSLPFMMGSAESWVLLNEQLITEMNWCDFSYNLLWEFGSSEEGFMSAEEVIPDAVMVQPENLVVEPTVTGGLVALLEITTSKEEDEVNYSNCPQQVFDQLLQRESFCSFPLFQVFSDANAKRIRDPGINLHGNKLGVNESDGAILANGFGRIHVKQQFDEFLVGRVVELQGWPPPASLFCSKNEFPSQMMFYVVRYFSSSNSVIKLGGRMELGAYYISKVFCVDSLGACVEISLPWSKVDGMVIYGVVTSNVWMKRFIDCFLGFSVFLLYGGMLNVLGARKVVTLAGFCSALLGDSLDIVWNYFAGVDVYISSRVSLCQIAHVQQEYSYIGLKLYPHVDYSVTKKGDIQVWLIILGFASQNMLVIFRYNSWGPLLYSCVRIDRSLLALRLHTWTQKINPKYLLRMHTDNTRNCDYRGVLSPTINLQRLKREDKGLLNKTLNATCSNSNIATAALYLSWIKVSHFMAVFHFCMDPSRNDMTIIRVRESTSVSIYMCILARDFSVSCNIYHLSRMAVLGVNLAASFHIGGSIPLPGYILPHVLEHFFKNLREDVYWYMECWQVAKSGLSLSVDDASEKYTYSFEKFLMMEVAAGCAYTRIMLIEKGCLRNFLFLGKDGYYYTEGRHNSVNVMNIRIMQEHILAMGLSCIVFSGDYPGKVNFGQSPRYLDPEIISIVRTISIFQTRVSSSAMAESVQSLAFNWKDVYVILVVTTALCQGNMALQGKKYCQRRCNEWGCLLFILTNQLSSLEVTSKKYSASIYSWFILCVLKYLKVLLRLLVRNHSNRLNGLTTLDKNQILIESLICNWCSGFRSTTVQYVIFQGVHSEFFSLQHGAKIIASLSDCSLHYPGSVSTTVLVQSCYSSQPQGDQSSYFRCSFQDVRVISLIYVVIPKTDVFQEVQSTAQKMRYIKSTRLKEMEKVSFCVWVEQIVDLCERMTMDEHLSSAYLFRSIWIYTSKLMEPAASDHAISCYCLWGNLNGISNGISRNGYSYVASIYSVSPPLQFLLYYESGGGWFCLDTWQGRVDVWFDSKYSYSTTPIFIWKAFSSWLCQRGLCQLTTCDLNHLLGHSVWNIMLSNTSRVFISFCCEKFWWSKCVVLFKILAKFCCAFQVGQGVFIERSYCDQIVLLRALQCSQHIRALQEDKQCTIWMVHMVDNVGGCTSGVQTQSLQADKEMEFSVSNREFWFPLMLCCRQSQPVLSKGMNFLD